MHSWGYVEECVRLTAAVVPRYTLDSDLITAVQTNGSGLITSVVAEGSYINGILWYPKFLVPR
jgi:hypothetical protein